MRKNILVIFKLSFTSILLSQDWNHYGVLGIGKYEYSNYLTVGWGGRKFYNDTNYKKWSLKIRDFDNEGIISVGYGWGKSFNKTRYFEIIPQFDYVITVEEQHINGGIGSLIAEIVSENNLRINLKRFAINDFYSSRHGSRDWLRKQYKIDTNYIIKETIKFLNKNKNK